jgi:hypothetical protein
LRMGALRLHVEEERKGEEREKSELVPEFPAQLSS